MTINSNWLEKNRQLACLMTNLGVLSRYLYIFSYSESIWQLFEKEMKYIDCHKQYLRVGGLFLFLFSSSLYSFIFFSLKSYFKLKILDELNWKFCFYICKTFNCNKVRKSPALDQCLSKSNGSKNHIGSC